MLRSHRLCLCIDEFCSPISSLGTAGMHIALKMIKRTVKAPKVTSWINREYQNTLLRAYNDEQIKSLNAHTERIRQTWIKFKEKNNTQSETISFNALCQQLYHFDWFMFCHSNRQSVTLQHVMALFWQIDYILINICQQNFRTWMMILSKSMLNNFVFFKIIDKRVKKKNATLTNYQSIEWLSHRYGSDIVWY